MAKIDVWADKAKIELHRNRIESLKTRAIELSGNHGDLIEEKIKMIQASTVEIAVRTVHQWHEKYDDLKLGDYEDMLNENLAGMSKEDEKSYYEGYTAEIKKSIGIESMEDVIESPEDLAMKINKLNLQDDDLLIFKVPESKRKSLIKTIERMAAKCRHINLGQIGILILDDDITIEKENAHEYYNKVKRKLEEGWPAKEEELLEGNNAQEKP